MKRYSSIFDKIVDIENIKLAHNNASKGKRKYKEVVRVNRNVDYYCQNIRDMLVNKTYKNSQYKEVIINENKKRTIYKLPYFPDRIIHHAVLQVLGEIWEKTFIKDTYQSIKGRGVHKCKNKIEKITCNHEIKDLYCLKIDIQKFYPSVDNKILLNIIKKKIKCKDTIELLEEIINSIEGLPIGNYISQHFGNLYLSYMDHTMKEKHKCKYYFRYCDDIVIIDEDKNFLHNIKCHLFKEIDSLNLKVNPCYQVFKIDKRPIDFLGYRFYRGYTLLRKGIIKRFKKCKPKRESVMSYYGWIKHCDANNLWVKHKSQKLLEIELKESRESKVNNKKGRELNESTK